VGWSGDHTKAKTNTHHGRDNFEVSMILLSTSKQIMGEYFKLGRDCSIQFLPNSPVKYSVIIQQFIQH
jgi:hypothetical protein